jgi:hypothetical protein
LNQKIEEWVWTVECEGVFVALKEKMCTAPVLAYPDPTRDFILDTDASAHRISEFLAKRLMVRSMSYPLEVKCCQKLSEITL